MRGLDTSRGRQRGSQRPRTANGTRVAHTAGTIVQVYINQHLTVRRIAGSPGSTPAASTEAPHDLAVVGGFVVGLQRRRRESAAVATRQTRAEAPEGAAAEPCRVRAERNDELVRASARLIPWPARRPRIRRQADRRPLPPPPCGGVR